MPKIPRSAWNHPSPDELYSLSEVARFGLLGGLERSTIYKYAKSGEIQTVKDERGQLRVTQAEIDRLRKLWKIEPDPELEKLLRRKARIEKLLQEYGGKSSRKSTKS